MANHIGIDGTATRLNGRLASLVQQASQLQEDMKRMKDIMGECGAAGTVDWASVEAKFGLKAGEGQVVYALLDAASQKINSADVDRFCNRLG